MNKDMDFFDYLDKILKEKEQDRLDYEYHKKDYSEEDLKTIYTHFYGIDDSSMEEEYEYEKENFPIPEIWEEACKDCGVFVNDFHCAEFYYEEIVNRLYNKTIWDEYGDKISPEYEIILMVNNKESAF